LALNRSTCSAAKHVKARSLCALNADVIFYTNKKNSTLENCQRREREAQAEVPSDAEDVPSGEDDNHVVELSNEEDAFLQPVGGESKLL
jgi:hypothetical protein